MYKYQLIVKLTKFEGFILSTVLVILTLFYFSCVTGFEVLRKVIPKDKSVITIYQTVQKWIGF